MRVGIIGMGFGAKVVAPTFEKTDGCSVVDVVSPRDDSAVASLCARVDVDLISVHSPPFMHLDHVGQAVQAGHAVLCDKPFGITADQAEAMSAKAAEAGVVALLNFEMRYDPVRQRLRSLIRSGSVGTPQHVQLNSFLSLARTPLRPFGWLFDASLGGGWIGAWGSHIIDFTRWTFGEIIEASAQLRTSVAERPDAAGEMRRCTAEDGFVATLRIDSGATVDIDSTFVAPASRPSQMTIIGSEAILEVVGDRRITRYSGAAEPEVLHDDDGTGGLQAPMRAWGEVVRDSVLSGKRPSGAPTFDDGLACRRVLDQLTS